MSKLYICHICGDPKFRKTMTATGLGSTIYNRLICPECKERWLRAHPDRALPPPNA